MWRVSSVKNCGGFRLLKIVFVFRKDASLVDQWEIRPEEITCLRKIGNGQFGEVHIAEMITRDSTRRKKDGLRKREGQKQQERKLTVAVKMLSGESEMLSNAFQHL